MRAMAEHQPSGHVWVEAYDYPSDQFVTGVDAQPDGAYSLALPTGSYRLRAQGDDYAFELYADAGVREDSRRQSMST